MMENNSLLRHLIDSVPISEEQAVKALTVVAGYAKERFPILEGTINNYLKQEFKDVDPDILSNFHDN